ncbi:MAG: hypothetical protein Q4E11_09420 [Corynebacterium sp.]|uniref:hypothetical protein n=1 Tax=Corynebacterium sp. TaxID=1720 RepID=UPI0026DB16C8|nr:hypothetical protein [Corynebacterium sp.]MDO5030779.1 hypothetical protein [Corynebacterium sp.]
MQKFIRFAGWALTPIVFAIPIFIAANAGATPVGAANDTATTHQAQRSILHTGKAAVDRFVTNLEAADGKDYVNIKFTGDHSAEVQILPDGMTDEGQQKVDQITDVLKLNGYDDIRFWAVL